MKIVLQDGIKDCGICCLLSIIRFYGGEVSKEYLREITNTTKDGVSLYDLIRAAEAIGFEAKGLTGNLKDINVNNLPCIAHFIVNKSYQHFVVLYDINKKKHQVTLMDPARGKKIISFSEFNLLTSKNYLFLYPLKQLPTITKKNIIYKNITKVIIKNKIIIIMTIILTLTYFLMNILTSFHFKYLLELSINYNITDNILTISYVMLILYLLKNINNILKSLLITKWTSSFDYEMTTITYNQILLLPYLFYKNRTTGEVISRFKDLNIIRNFIANFFSTIIIDSVSVIIFSATMYNSNKKLTIVIWGISCCLLFKTYIINLKKKKLQKAMSKSEDKINSYIIEGIANVDTIKGSHLEKRLIDNFAIKYKKFLDIAYKFNFCFCLSNFLENSLIDLVYLIIYSLGSYSVIMKKMSLSNLIVYQMLFSYYFNCLSNLLSLIDSYTSYKNALERVEDLFLINEEVFKNNYFYLPYTLNGNIVIKDLNYQIGSKKIFKNLNLEIVSGEKILLCGESGSGKSTLVKMLMRYIQTEFGNITISNIDINHYHLENLRTNITYVSSNEYLFTNTIKKNIMLKEEDEEEFLKVCDTCLLNDIIKDNELKYDQLVEENGFNLSNGERQRIILARSLMRRSNIYIYDEALGQIDINKEKKILLNIFNYLKDKTVIVISHRNNNKKLFDRVLKLENGVINENKKL